MTPRRLILVAVAFLVAVCGVIPAAQAHDYLVGSSPKASGSVAAAPKTVTLTFDDIVLTRPARPQVTVQGPDGRYYETGCATVTDRVVTTPVALGPAGKYTVTWRIVSADGHPVSDNISFDLTGKGGGSGIASPKPCTTQASGGGSRSGSGSRSDGVPGGAIVAVVVIAIVGVGGSAVILLTRSRDRQADGVDDFDDDEE
ncbi:copper resistance CopC family protein [Flexivirga caeni]|nr:copper resistance CopC family protein [Flexivirga caeni]